MSAISIPSPRASNRATSISRAFRGINRTDACIGHYSHAHLMDRLAAGLRMIDAHGPRHASRHRRDARTMKTIPPKLSTNLHFLDPMHQFHSDHYLRHNARRLEHLASLELDVRGATVLEIGSGIGDHSHYYLDSECKIMITEARKINLDILKGRYPSQNISHLDLEHHIFPEGNPFDIVHCYGTLYHVGDPGSALLFISRCCQKHLFLETCVPFGHSEHLNPVSEPHQDPTQAISGVGCRPTRLWLFKKLQELFQYVYLPTTQPNHEEFPLDRDAPEKHSAQLSRAIFIASREEIRSDHLVPTLINQQKRHPYSASTTGGAGGTCRPPCATHPTLVLGTCETMGFESGKFR
jgi:hypothetical protein